jgi:spore coat protein U-like protein
MKYFTLAFALGFLASALASRPVLAATQTASFSVTVTVVSSCQISAPAIAPGSYTAARANPTSPVSVNCTMPTPYNVSYRTDPAPSVTVTTRKSASPETAPGTSNRFPQPDAASGQPAGAQHDTPGTNADLVTVTITY